MLPEQATATGSTPSTPATTHRPWWSSSAPPRPTLRTIGVALIGAAVGATVGLVGHSLWFGALAGALALAAMMLARVPHSPAAATAVIGTVSATVPGWEFALLAGAAAVVLVLVGVVVNRANGVPEHPLYLR